MTEAQTMPLPDDRILPEQEMLRRACEFRELAARRRTVRAFDSRPVARELIAECIAAAGTAPSGANQQPWHFVAISDPAVKQRIRLAAEQEERAVLRATRHGRMARGARAAGDGLAEPFLETAPWLIAIFVQKWGRAADGAQGQALLPHGVRRHRHRHPDHGASHRRPRDVRRTHRARWVS